jgi:hypothetical protein
MVVWQAGRRVAGPGGRSFARRLPLTLRLFESGGDKSVVKRSSFEYVDNGTLFICEKLLVNEDSDP